MLSSEAKSGNSIKVSFEKKRFCKKWFRHVIGGRLKLAFDLGFSSYDNKVSSVLGYIYDLYITCTYT